MATPTPTPACRIDLSLPIGYGLSPNELVELAVRAEEAGLDTVCVGELASTELFSMAGAIAASTSRIAIESSIAAAVTRSAALYGMGAVTLSHLSGGRFALGLGAGSEVVAAFHETALAHPLELVRRCALDVRAVTAGEQLADAGGFRLRGLEPRPVPILLSAMNDGMVRLAGQVADGMVLNFADEREVARRDALARAERSDDRPFGTHTVLWLYVGDDVDTAHERFRMEMAPYLAVGTYRNASVRLAGEAAVAATADAHRAGGRRAGASVFPDAITDALLVVGTAADVASRVRSMAAAGCAGVRFTPIADEPTDRGGRVVDLLGDVVRLLR